MEAVKFNAKIKNGTIRIPPSHIKELEGEAEVIVLKRERSKRDGTGKIHQLMDNPIKVKNFVPLTREEANER